jgi:hypothetical protein
MLQFFTSLSLSPYSFFLFPFIYPATRNQSHAHSLPYPTPHPSTPHVQIIYLEARSCISAYYVKSFLRYARVFLSSSYYAISSRSILSIISPLSLSYFIFNTNFHLNSFLSVCNFCHFLKCHSCHSDTFTVLFLIQLCVICTISLCY